MLKDVTKIKICGLMFDSLTTFDLFNPYEDKKEKTVKAAILYGRNGAGKSTLAKAFRKISGEEVPEISNAIFCDSADKPVTLGEEEKKQIFVFDENYVDKNVKLQQDHLDTIVMLGPAADLTKKIEEAEEIRESARKAYEEQEMECKEYCDSGNVKSPRYYLIGLGNALRGDDNWAGRDKEIVGARQNTSVREETYKQFLLIVPSKSRSDLIVDYKTKIKELKTMRTGATMISEKVPEIPELYLQYDCEKVVELLSEEIEKPELTEREKKLLELIEKGNGEQLTEKLIFFRDQKPNECPYCFQPITDEYRCSLVERLERVLNETVEEHQHNLRDLNLCLVKMNLESYSMLPGYQVCIELVAALNESIQASNGTVKSKIDNPYEPQIVSGFMIREYAEQLTEALAQLEKERVEHNDVPKKTNRLIAELKKINGEIAYYDVIELSKQFDKQQEEFEKAKKLRDKSKVAYEASKKTVEGLQAQRNNVHLAVEAINSCFKYIFFAENRLRIEFVDGVYKLFSNGKSVKPSDVSMGERSIIGLSYFFTSIFEGREEVDAYKPECLLVIDDPVCSYDIENRIGILSFLKYKLSMHLEGNINTKVLVMTHDLPTFYDIHKLLEEIVESCKSQGYANTPKFNRFELRDKLLMPFSYKKRQEYTELIEMVYKYATGQVSNYDFVIGNMMRQVLEAFSTFEYKKGIEGVSTDAQILSLLPSIEYVSYYKNLMYRLVLHGGSHKEEQVKTMSDFNFFALISEQEKRRTAKDVLCFIYLLNKRHLLEHLKACGDVESELDSWCEDIKQRAVVV